MKLRENGAAAVKTKKQFNNNSQLCIITFRRSKKPVGFVVDLIICQENKKEPQKSSNK